MRSSAGGGQCCQLVGWIGPFFAVDAPASSELTRQRLDRTPTRPGLIEDLDAGSDLRA